MLRITVHTNQKSLTFQLEGTLAGAWVGTAEECRRSTLAGRRWPAIRFDLAGVTFIDAVGKAFLATVHRQGAELVGADCFTRAIVTEVANVPVPSSL